MQILQIILDVVSVALLPMLVAVIIIGLRLNHQIITLKRNRAELEKLFLKFSQATVRAEGSLENIRLLANNTDVALQRTISHAESAGRTLQQTIK
ncbi:MAG: DUF6468 domain-containing protein, partial [Pseudomonadota bacterium]